MRDSLSDYSAPLTISAFVFSSQNAELETPVAKVPESGPLRRPEK
jgi:hypothetical protein